MLLFPGHVGVCLLGFAFILVYTSSCIVADVHHPSVCACLQDSQLVAGVAFKKTFSYAGFEMQPKCYQNPKIALLNVELELKAEKENAEVRVKSVEVSKLA